jgi:hypothetical protein
MALLVLGDTALRVGLPALFTNCPNFKEELPDHVRSPVSVEAFQMFAEALEGTVPVVTTENMHDLLSLCHEFGFSGLLSQVTDLISAHSVADFEARKRISDLEAKNRQQDRKLCLLQKEVIDLREARKAQMQDIAEIREGRSREAAELSRLGRENVSLTQAGKVQKQEISALGCTQAKSDKEMGELRAQFAQEQTNQAREREAVKQEMAELQEAQTREIAALRSEFREQLSGLREQLGIVKEAQE